MSAIHRVTEAGPVHDEREIEAVVEVLRSGNLDLGPALAEFERRGADLLAKRHGVMVNSGTSALWLAVDLLGCEPGDEVITSPLTFSSDVAPLVRSGSHPHSTSPSASAVAAIRMRWSAIEPTAAYASGVDRYSPSVALPS